MKIGIVIQGPLMSVGRTSKNLSWRELTDSHIVNFDCVSTISEYFKKYSHNYNIVCSTWENEEISLKKNLISKVGLENVLFNIDKTRPLKKVNNGILPQNNKHRQILSTLQGLKYLKSKGCEKFIKVRTDQVINIELIAKQIMLLNNFFFPLKNKNDLAHTEDIYFAGNTDVSIKMFENYLNTKEMHSNVHYDYTFSFASFLMNKNFYFSKFYHKKNNFLKIFYKEQLELLWKNHFSPLDEEVFKNYRWRGNS